MAFTQRNMAAGTPVKGPGKAAPRDMTKHNATVDVKKGESLSKDPDMLKKQLAAAKAKSDKWSRDHGGKPATAANLKAYGK